ncbi:MATE family efflux transporter [Thermodesulfobacteriota bacterium]
MQQSPDRKPVESTPQRPGADYRLGGRTLDGDEESDEGGYREVLRIAVPLILSTASLTITLFVDRMFLAWYGRAAVAAATPAGITYFTICCLFMGTAQYVNTIVAQHFGKGDKPACARAVWQGVFFAVACAPIILACIPLGRLVLSHSGHGETLIQLEKTYYSILMLGGVMLPLQAALSSFFSGRGRTKVVMWGNFLGNMANIALDYLLIFGKLGFPAMGIRGAGIATAVTMVIPVIYWGAIFLGPRMREAYGTIRELRWDSRLFFMLLRYGLPSGLQFFLDIASFAAFVLLVGRLGELDLAISNIVLSIELLSFLPMVGMSLATATLVGQYIGQDRTHLAEKSVRSALRLSMAYMTTMAALYMLFPDFFLELFRVRANPGSEFELLLEKGRGILRVVAMWTLFDTLFIVYSGALKGAGDTRFAMWAQVILAWGFFVPPVYVMLEYLHLGLTAVWSWGLVYVIVLGVVFRARFRSGRWKRIQMVEEA